MLRFAALYVTLVCGLMAPFTRAEDMEKFFAEPPESARPWVYWMFMDGNLSREGITADLEAMKRAGIGGAIIMETNIGIPRGPVEFMSVPWRDQIKHAIDEADRLGLEIALAAGPGWCGTGGPWVKPEQSMQHLVGSETATKGPAHFDAVLPKPAPRKPFFGEQTLTPELKKLWKEFYRDVAVLAFPTPTGNVQIADVNEKALYHRAPYSSAPGVKPFLPAPAQFAALPAEQCVASDRIVDLTGKLAADGRLVWDVPPGDWTLVRLGRTITGQTSRPAPAPGLGFESDKFDTAAIDAHFAAFIGELLKTVGRPKHADRGLTMLHFDSWEMSSQNWSEKFRDEFRARRGYDPLRFLPAMLGRVVDSLEISERFLWDLRQTAQELVVENHALRLKKLGAEFGLKLSIEPYDLNPCSDLKLGGAADMPMCEFWSKGFGFHTEFSCIEAASIAHTLGRNVVPAEAFTAASGEAWKQHPGSMKDQGDWALCCGVNRFTFHRYQHQPWLDRFPGMTFGPYGVHWERTQTWWNMVLAYHLYLARCQQMLRVGRNVADVLYLNPEGAPMVFRPPSSAMVGELPDRRGYNFDGCSPEVLIESASVQRGRIVLASGASYALLALPRFETMTPALLQKIQKLVDDGATVIGTRPSKSPSLVDYPKCDADVAKLAALVWDSAREHHAIADTPATAAARSTNALAGAKWIWHNEGTPGLNAPVCKRFFRRTISVAKPMDEHGLIDQATFTMTADNSFELFIDGKSVGRGDNFHERYVFDVSSKITALPNQVLVEVENGGDEPNPAGLIGALEIRFANGKQLAISTDSQWQSAQASNGPWAAARELGAWNMAPWHLKDESSPPADIYPSYDTTAQILQKMAIPPDFESNGALRYIHRRDGETDIYFVANREGREQTAICTFRVAGRQPECWSPVTGERRMLTDFRQDNGVSSLQLRFAPYESAFVVFRSPIPAVSKREPNFFELKTAATLAGPWDVAFDPAWGGPAHVTFTALEDWSKRAEPDIRHFSGTAKYKTTFALPAPKSKRVFIDLGKVAVMAQVALNGKDLGVVWCDPLRVEIPAGLLRETGNELEIAVANLWINRLIGDAGLPADKRRTWTTWSPYKKDSPLVPSGLLGPVRVIVE